MKTEIQFKTLSPVWDQTLIFEAVEICGDHEDIVKNPPVVNIELYDHDEIVSFLAENLDLMNKPLTY